MLVYSTGPDGRIDPAGYAAEPFGPDADLYLPCCAYGSCWCYDGVNDQ